MLPGYRDRHPNLPRRLILRASGTRLGARLLAKSLRRIDDGVLRLTSGRRTFAGIATGLPAVVLVTTGARSGQIRRSPVLGIPFEDAIAVVGGNFGQPAGPAWTYNLAAHPDAEIEYGGQTIAVTARLAVGAERTAALATAIDAYPPYETYIGWASGRAVPVLVLERRGS